jgi:hypothetical protein
MHLTTTSVLGRVLGSFGGHGTDFCAYHVYESGTYRQQREVGVP